MKFLVDRMPMFKEDCPFSKKKFNPPIIEDPYYIICTLDNDICDCNIACCRYMKKVGCENAE